METKEKKATGTATRRRRAAQSKSARTTRNAAPAKKPAVKRPAARKKSGTGESVPQVVYTAPVPTSRMQIILRLATVLAVVAALVFGMSIFFKVENITVSGSEKYSAWDVAQASGISQGDNLLTLSKPRACGKIKAALPYVDSVRIGIKLPNTVNIVIEELDVVYAAKASDGVWWLMTSGGLLVEPVDSATASEHTAILGVQLDHPKVGAQASAFEPSRPAADDADGEYRPVTVTAAEKLAAAEDILQYLEANNIIGEAASLDVSNLNALEIWYGSRYQIELGDTTNMSYKISSMKAAIRQMDDYQSGILDVSYTVWPDQVIYTPFN